MSADVQIFVPTFDRNQKLIDTITAILAMDGMGGRTITVIDNCSKVPVEKTLADSALDLSRIAIVRNRCNVGANANILRCFELSESDWVWMIGDSDHPYKSSLAKVQAAIREHPDALRIGFSKTEGAGVATGARGFIDNINSFGQTLFISSAVYKAAELRRHINIGYHFCYSMAPHLALLLSSLGSGGKTVSVDEDIVNPEKPDAKDCWPTLPSYLGFSTLVELPGLSSIEDMRALGRKIVPSSQPIIKSYYQLQVANRSAADRKRGMYAFNEVSTRAIHSSAMLSQLLIFILLKLSLMVPGMPQAIVKLIERRLGRKPVVVADFRRL
jgi:abequosyltransferase